MDENTKAEIERLFTELRAIDSICPHWDYEDESPECEHTDRRDAIKREIYNLLGKRGA
jgi:hypothetical protein